MTISRRVLITGATGFLGRGLVPALSDAGYAVRAATRTPQIVARFGNCGPVSSQLVENSLHASRCPSKVMVDFRHPGYGAWVDWG